ncbi:chemotaxis protein CheW [Metabacillus sp. 84]|uniref:chemotaxis protein CheW n=1 Tax=unclassified Metabacillus TaxID=2675274 RepID=UPI003CE6AD69
MQNSQSETKIIIFRLGEEEFGIPVNQVKSIEKIQSITRVPGTDPYIKGVINLRGVVTPVIDLRKRFELSDAEYTEHSRMIVVAVHGIEAGLAADAANDVTDISFEQIEPSPEVAGMIKTDYISGVVKLGKRLIIMLDLAEVLEASPAAAADGVK